jgi:hypothetical protein
VIFTPPDLDIKVIAYYELSDDVGQFFVTEQFFEISFFPTGFFV